VRKANQLSKGPVELRFPTEAEHNTDRSLTGKRALTAALNMSVLRGGLEGMKFPMMMWLGYIVGSQRRS